MTHLTRLGTCFGLLSAIVLNLPLFASSPSSGTLTDSSPVVTYTGGPYYVANATDQANSNAYPTCSTTIPAEQCDMFTLAVNVAGGDSTTKQIRIDINWSPVTEADYDVYVYSGAYQNSGANVIASNPNGNDPAEVIIPAVSGTYTIVLDPFNPAGDTFAATITLENKPTQNPPPSGVAPRYQVYPAPNNAGGANASGEPSIGVDWNPDVASLKHDMVNQGGVAFFTANLAEFRVDFDDCSSPAGSLWESITSPVETVNTLDPIGYCDHFGPGTTPGRVFQSQLSGSTSLIAYSDLTTGAPYGTDGNSWTQSSGPPPVAGVDHETLGGGPYSATCTGGICPSHPTYPNAVYYCSQDVETAFCERSDDGGATFGAEVPIYNATQCTGIHGHVKVAPDGTVYVPNRSCGANQGVAVSTDNGITWTVQVIPDSTAGNTDPSVGIASDGTVYFGYQDGSGLAKIAVSHDRGMSWSASYNAGAQFGLLNTVFPEVVAGDPLRAAFMFLGTPSGGNYQATTFTGIWHAYVASTFDGGMNYYLVDTTPTDPVQIGTICNAGTTCPSARNLLDFNDVTSDAQGRVVSAFADGCVAGSCSSGSTAAASTSALGTIIRQSGGRRLYAAFDPVEPAVPGAPLLISALGMSNGVLVSWNVPDNGGAPLTGYQILRGTVSGGETPLVTIGPNKASYLDTTALSGTYYYKVKAINAQGSSLTCGELTSVPAPPPQSPCVLPGLTVVTSPTGNQVGAPANSQLDIQSISVAEPYPSADGNNQLYFTMKVANLTAPLAPNQTWNIFFNIPDTAGTTRYVDMNTNGAGGAVAFEYGHVTNTGGVNMQVSDGPVDAHSTYSADGTIVIIVDDSLLGTPGGSTGLVPGNQLVSINGKTQLLVGGAGTGLLETIDSTVNGAYLLVGNLACQPHTVALASSPNPSTGGQTVAFTATVTPAPTYASGLGDVVFNANGKAIGALGLLSNYNGVVTLDYSSFLPGTTYNVTATYNGSVLSSTSNTVSQVVDAEPTTTTIAAGSTSLTYGQSVTLTATVSSTNSATPTGAVVFKNGTTVLGTVALAKSGTGTSQAVLNNVILPAGMNAVTADYTGSNLMQASTSAAVTVDVSQATSTTTITSSTNPSVYGQKVTFTAVVAPQDGGTATGKVTFYNNGTSIGVASLSSSQASLSISTLMPGSDTITAAYNGSNNVAGSTGTLTGGPQVVNQANSTATVVSSSPTVTHGTPVTFTAAVTTTAPSTAVPAGSVVFYDTFNSTMTQLGTGTLSNGKATLTHTYTAAQEGSHSISATYTGSADVNASPASPSITQTVD